jgi:catechol 2,3-dioxygenase-like lactoylglutathione lyase family enzyme
MLAHSEVATRLPAKDLTRARRFYSEKLGLEPIEERPGGLRYRCGGGSFALFESAAAASGTHTQMAWEVADIEATVSALRRRGVFFEEYDLPVPGDRERHRDDPGELSEQGRRRARRLVQRQRGEPAGPRPGGTVSRNGCCSTAASMMKGNSTPIALVVLRYPGPPHSS